MSISPFITGAGTNAYLNSITNIDQALATLNQFDQIDEIDTRFVKSIVPGINITVDNTDPANPVVAASGNIGVASLTAGTGPVTVTGTGSDPIINVANTTLNSVGGGQTLINDGLGPDIFTKSLLNGNGIDITSNLTNITIGLSAFEGFSARLIPNGLNTVQVMADTIIGNFAPGTVAWELLNSGGGWDIASGTWTVEVSGIYLLMFQICTDGSTDIGYISNGLPTIISSGGQTSSGESCVGGSIIVNLLAGNTLSLKVDRTAFIRVYPQNKSAGAIYTGGTCWSAFKIF